MSPLLGQQSTDRSAHFSEQPPNRLIDSNVVRSFERRRVALQIPFGLLQFQQYEPSLIAKGGPCFFLLDGRIGFDRDGELRLQALNLQPCAEEAVICPIQVESFFAGCNLDLRERLAFESDRGSGMLLTGIHERRVT